ncbi:hypothetical protein Pcinc_036212 [Petrolisthes cinctipes]|uniref:von Hippel-Lindau disease tumour suppressor beta domain-containing protein n=1 Tax=Petrolisthes cinctipes TaxID=88211 RepID=A0AAE1BUY9_PETCI|nr:hypothetical protein Pcinc_036212 [Petrolisthes cinctipes]
MADAGPGHHVDDGAEPERNDVQQSRPPLRSVTSQTRTFVRFVNRTRRYVDVIWLDFRGVKQTYTRLGPGQLYKVVTYITHPWIFRDAETNCKLLVNSQEIYYPKPMPQIPLGHPVYGQASRNHISAYISIPLYTLKVRAAQVVQLCLGDLKDAHTLDIPKNLVDLIVNLGAERQ